MGGIFLKEHIYTIPVTDGFNKGGECPFCDMLKTLEKDSVDYILGPAYMTDTIRLETDKTGFCEKHIKQMYDKQNRLGTALMLSTHLDKINSFLDSEIASYSFVKQKKTFFGKNKETNSNIPSYLNNITNSCYICNRIDTYFERYIETFFYMWSKTPEIKDIVINSKGFCLKHFSMLIEKGETYLSENEYKNFLKIIFTVQQENLKRLKEELEWFINKFDYKYKDEPWKTSEDALIRSITKINSAYVEEKNNDG